MKVRLSLCLLHDCESMPFAPVLFLPDPRLLATNAGLTRRYKRMGR